MTIPTLDVHVRGISIRFAVLNPRLRVWAERFEEIEPELLDFIDELPEGAVFYDAGASIGLFSLYAAIKRGARAVAFEAEAQNFGVLELNHYLNRANLRTPIDSFNVALSDEFGVGRMFMRVYGAGEHVKILDVSETRDTHEAFEPEHVQTVLKMPLDHFVADLGLPPPYALKIDVDGSEEPLLRGAARTLADPNLQVVFLEINAEAGSSEEAMLTEAGFRLARRDPVVRLRGGFYPGLYNCVFRR